ncbi:MAG: alpha/beta hydrolase [Chloroflexi bacterium]|nr:alpha/beta hydrolase [Chloroflexota bacterium]
MPLFRWAVVEHPAQFYSGGCRLAADVYVPDGATASDRRPGVVLCCGYTGIKDLYLNDMARRFAAAGYVALTFDYKGWGQSEGPRLRLAPYSRVEDAQAALTLLSLQPEVDAERIALYGISYGGSTAVFAAAIDRRAAAVIGVTGVGNGARWMQRVRRPWEFRELVERGERDRARQVVSGVSELVDRGEVLMHDPQSAEIAARARAAVTGAAMQVPLEMVHETIGFNPEWVVDRIAPRPALFITSDRDELVLPEESEMLHARAGEPKKLVVLRGFGHYEVFVPPAIDQVIAEAVDWLEAHFRR